jgi:mRNA-degrading endonuclease RelE of RelBE toxin-antitoxin system
MTNKPIVSVSLTPFFIKRLSLLKKKYPRVPYSVQALIQELESGATPGEQLTGVDYTAYKCRLANPDAKKGKRGGFRLIYYVKTNDQVILITIYSKSDQTDIAPEKIKSLIEDTLRRLSGNA